MKTDLDVRKVRIGRRIGLRAPWADRRRGKCPAGGRRWRAGRGRCRHLPAARIRSDAVRWSSCRSTSGCVQSEINEIIHLLQSDSSWSRKWPTEIFLLISIKTVESKKIEPAAPALTSLGAWIIQHSHVWRSLSQNETTWTFRLFSLFCCLLNKIIGIFICLYQSFIGVNNRVQSRLIR